MHCVLGCATSRTSSSVSCQIPSVSLYTNFYDGENWQGVVVSDFSADQTSLANPAPPYRSWQQMDDDYHEARHYLCRSIQRLDRPSNFGHPENQGQMPACGDPHETQLGCVVDLRLAGMSLWGMTATWTCDAAACPCRPGQYR